VLRGYILRYLAVVALGGSTDTARGDVPAPLRPWVVKAADKRVITSGFSTVHADDAAHLHRLAYLAVISVPTINDDDVAGVQETFEENRLPRTEAQASVGLTSRLSLVAIVVASAAGAVFYAGQSRSPADDSTAADEGTQETEETAPDLEELLGMDEPAPPAHLLDPIFGEALPDFVVALDRKSSGEERPAPDDVASARTRLLDALRADAPDLVEPMEALLEATEGYVDRVDGYDDMRWTNELVLLHDALETADVPYYVDATLRENTRTGRRRVLVSTWDVRRRRVFRAGQARVRALDITRRDNLNFRRSLLGYTRPEIRGALIVIDRIESFLIEQVLPSVNDANDSVIVRDYADETDTAWVTRFEQWAHEDLRREAERIVLDEMGHARGLEALAGAIVARRNGVVALSNSLGSSVSLREPTRYEYDLSDVQFPESADHIALRHVREAELELHTPDAREAYRVLVDARALSVAEHEVQHRLDYEADRLIDVPVQLNQYTGNTGALEHVNRRAERANAELSAYLCQIATRPALAWTSLVHVASFIMSRPSWGMPEAYAAVALFEGLADEAGIAHGPLIARRRIDRGETARIYGELRARGTEDLAGLARRTWASLYGEELVDIHLEE